MRQPGFSIRKRIKSFGYAFNGLRLLIKEEHNAWIHVMATILAILLGFAFTISKTEWVALVFSIGFVFALELVNSAIENLADYSSPGTHELIKKVKDLSAAAVLIAAITALSIGLLIFIPKIV